MRRISLLALVITLLTGCSSLTPPGNFKDHPGVAAARSKVRGPVACKIAVAPIVFDSNKPGEDEIAGMITESPNNIYNGLITALKNNRAFKLVRPLEFKKTVLTTKEFDDNLKDFIETAKRGGIDMLMKFTIKKFKTVYKGTNSGHFPSILLWVTLWWPSWMIADETYSSEIDLAMEIYSVSKKEKIASLSRTFRIKRDFDLDDFQRGWQIFGILRVPGSLGEGNWKAVSDLVTPHAVYDLKAEVVTHMLSPEFRSRILANIEKKKGRSMALIVGINDYANQEITDLVCAENDAREMSNFARESGVYSGGVTTLTGTKNVTLAKVRSSLNKIFSEELKTRPKVFIYLSCHGVMLKTGPALAFSDYDPEKPETALPLSEIAASFKALEEPPKELVLIVDTGFGAPAKSTRGISDPKLVGRMRSSFLDDLAASSGRAVLFSTSAGENAVEVARRKHGMFTLLLLQGIKGRANTDGDKKVSIMELYKFTAERVTTQANLFGVEQHPTVKGPAANMGVFGTK